MTKAADTKTSDTADKAKTDAAPQKPADTNGDGRVTQGERIEALEAQVKKLTDAMLSGDPHEAARAMAKG